MKKLAIALCVLTVGWLAATRASALPTIVYDNGPVNGNLNAFYIGSGGSISDSFTLSAPTTITQAQFGAWVDAGDTPTSVDWSIGSSAFNNDFGSGTGTLTNTPFLFNNSFGDDVYESKFSLSDVLGPGTYWLTLGNGVASTPSDPVFWDQNNGPSTATDGESLIASESFQLFTDSVGSGISGAIPEPAGPMLVVLGAAALMVYGSRRHLSADARR
jgi:hypothetical protein